MLMVKDGNSIPRSAPSRAVLAPGALGAGKLQVLCRAAPPAQAGPPSTLLCSRSFAPAQASAGTDTYLKKSSHKPLLHSAKP